jgi:8-oxo-dGTP pyrophosphatase MutT (NUDIX family)
MTVEEFRWTEVDDADVEKYFADLRIRGDRHLGSSDKGEIEILVDRKVVRRELEILRTKRYAKLVEKLGHEEALAKARALTQLGFTYADGFMIVFRDLVQFPSKIVGTYIAQSWGKGSTEDSGVAVVPITADGRLVLVDCFRHATRARSLEFVRGGMLHGERIQFDGGKLIVIPTRTIEAECLQELGYKIEDVQYIGALNPDTGLLQQHTHLFVGRGVQICDPAPEVSEAIFGPVELTVGQMNAALREGRYKSPTGSVIPMTGGYEPAIMKLLELHGHIHT